MFDFENASLPIRDDLTMAFRDAWHQLANAGTWWTGAERVSLAGATRSAYEGEPAQEDSTLPTPAIAAAIALGQNPAGITEERIAGWEAEGLDSYRYVELVAVVARVTAIDTFHRALELELEPMPAPQSGEPTRILPNPAATKTKAWVPMVGPPTIPTSLSAVPAEMEALEPLHGPMYLSYAEMGNAEIQKGLHRSQIELVAARTSAINECFF
jgi:alkylhydroperoxidase family enzyme